MSARATALALALAWASSACGGGDAGGARDAGDAREGADVVDAAATRSDASEDAGLEDATAEDATTSDVRSDAPTEDARADAAAVDARLDAALADARLDAALADARLDAALRDARSDAALTDTRSDAAPPPDAGGCVSGATGTRAVRFRWEGSGGTGSSTAYVRYEANELPDASRWRVTANARAIGYRPVFTDVFLGEGGLELATTGFIDVELSTAGLTALRGVTLAIYGRSFNTTASGSFRWQTFDGTGAAPSNLVANSAPYEWYRADASAAFVAGNGGVLLRIFPGPSSNALIVRRVELCFDAR